jgi:hypothetical protein
MAYRGCAPSFQAVVVFNPGFLWRFPLSSKSVLQFFFRDGATSALFRWLDFRLFVARSDLTLVDAALSPVADSVSEWLLRWEQQASLTTPVRGLFLLLSLLMVVLGFVAMTGVLNVSQPINIWVPLLLFAFLPGVLTLGSAYLALLSPARQQLDGHPLLGWLVAKLRLGHFLPYKTVLMPWLFWKAQALALLFSLSALLSFFALATFQDYRFGWSSTLIGDNSTMTSVMAVICAPWQWLVDAPSAALIDHSRFTAGGVMAPMAVGDRTLNSVDSWWLTLVMAMLVYGLLPRVCLALLLRYRFVRSLRQSILDSADVEAFVLAQQQQSSINPLSWDDVNNPSANEALTEAQTEDQKKDQKKDQPEEQTDDQAYQNNTSRAESQGLAQTAGVDLISWQQPQSALMVVKNLGSDDWAEDERWLNSAEAARSQPVCVLVDPLQTPTGELADCLDLLRQKNASVILVLQASPADNRRYELQLKSWQFFAKRNRITLKQET